MSRAARATGRFLWKFFGGDTPEVLLTAGLVVALAFLLRSDGAVPVVVLPLVVLAGLGFGLWRARRAST